MSRQQSSYMQAGVIAHMICHRWGQHLLWSGHEATQSGYLAYCDLNLLAVTDAAPVARVSVCFMRGGSAAMDVHHTAWPNTRHIGSIHHLVVCFLTS